MIFITLGTQKQSFKRLMDEIENCKLIDNEKIIAQIGYTEFSSKKIKTFDFLEMEEFNKYIEDAEFVITHGGVGAIFSALSKNKKVIAIPRLKKYNEHVDDHQIEICKKLASLGHIVYYNPADPENIENPDSLEQKINFLRSSEFQRYIKDNSYLYKLDNCIENFFFD